MISTDRGQKELKYYLKDKIPVETATKIIQGLCSIIEHTVLKSYCEFYKLSTPFKIRIIGTIVSETLANLDLSETCIDDIIQIIVSELNIDYHYPFVSWYNDGLVNLSSQLGLYGGTRSGTEVTSGLGNPIDIAISPYVKIHIGYTRLICLGNDSPNASVQAFDWIAYNVMGTSQGMVTVSQFGTITGTVSGWVTIRGTYKYNTKYIVIITILVI